MNYKKIHDQIINRAKDRLLEGYTEKHHIIPRCMNGTNKSDNLIYLTPDEHYVVHQLLVKMYPQNHKLIFAAQMMTMDSNGNRVNNKLYGWLRKKFSESMTGENNPMYGIPGIFAGRKHSEESKQKMSIAKSGKHPSEETRRKISVAITGENHPLFGKTGENSPNFGKHYRKRQK